MIKSEERIRNIKEYILEFQFTYHRTPTMAQIAEAVGTVKSNVYISPAKAIGTKAGSSG